MRIGIVSDIHGNLEALEALLLELKSNAVDYMIHLGDLVGYNANPRECLHIIQKEQVICVLGNHDLAVFEPRTAESFNVLAHQALSYSRRELFPQDVRFLQNLPRVEVLWDQYLICHGTPENVETYIVNMFQAKRIFNLLKKSYDGIRICFFGHTHVQKMWISDERGKVFSPPSLPDTVSLEPDNLYLINPGSIGQPRQKDNRARYLVFDSDRGTIHFKAVAYDIEKAQRKIIQARLPEYLALRLQEGI